MVIDWAALRAAAAEVAERAYAPYSRLRVGAAGLTADGQIVVGCNVENASYGLTLCAECGLVSALHAAAPAGPPSLVAVSVVAGDGAPLLPCGRCRQLLLEAGGPGLLVETEAGPQELISLLPAAFTTDDLAERREETGTAQREGTGAAQREETGAAQREETGAAQREGTGAAQREETGADA